MQIGIVYMHEIEILEHGNNWAGDIDVRGASACERRVHTLVWTGHVSTILKKKVVLFKKYYNGSLQENVIKRPEACPLLYKLQYNLFILSFVYAIIK